ncbi:hypothetical protein AB0K43_21185 [Kitasatospora sp. NPDC049258]|uniref:hypothetical protein n=1 Tax=Kitasatospora sp. NPDC049258 TaxID=3155394 RepID=UPI00343C10D4
MLIPEEVDGLPEPDEGPLTLPGFWAAYLPRYLPPPAEEAGGGTPAGAAFGVSRAAADAARAALAGAAGRPIAKVPLEHDHTVLAVPRPTALDLLLTHPHWRRPRLLARTGGRPAGPGLSWSELLHAARHPGTSEGITARHPRLLLLLPALRAATLPPDAAVTVAAALAATGTPQEQRPALAHRLVELRPALAGARGQGTRGPAGRQGRLLARALGAAA